MRKRWKLVMLLCVCMAAFAVYLVYSALRADTTPPVITVAGGSESVIEVSMADLHDVLLRDVTAQDERDGDVTSSILIEQIGGITDDNQAQAVYAAFDAAGNVAKLRRTVRIIDYRQPRFTLDGPLNFIYGSNFDPLKLVGAEDLVDGNISHRVKATLMDESAITAEGTHNVQFRVTNSLGDTVQLVLPVEVYYAGRYDAQLFLTDYLVYLPVNGDFAPERYLDKYLVYGQATDLCGGVPTGLTLTTTGHVDTSKPGVYVVSYTMSSVRGNNTSYGYTRLIVIVEG